MTDPRPLAAATRIAVTLSTATFTAAALLVLPGRAAGQDASRSKAIDAMFEPWNRTDSPGAAVLVLQDGAVVHRKGYGMADLEHGVKITPSTVFDIASVSKQFCGLAIAMLVEQKKIGIDDDVRKFVPWVPEFGGRRIRIDHLAHHTSGIRDWPGTLRLAGWRFDDVISFDQILTMLRHQRDLNFDPGKAFTYSNTGYNLLAHVVEKISGVSFAQWTKVQLFDPLGMRDTHFHDDHKRLVPNRALAYDKTPRGFKNIANQLTAVGSSSLFSTVDDLAKWTLNFETKKVGGSAAIARMHTKGVLNDGREIPYCFGVNRAGFRGVEAVSHTGSWAGFRTVLFRVPEKRFAVIVLANTATIRPESFAHKLAELYLANDLAPFRSAATGAYARSVPKPAPDLQPFAGCYRSAELDTAYTITPRNGKLVMQHFRNGAVPLRYVAGDVFAGPWWAANVAFVRGEGGRIVGLTVSSARCLEMRFDRVLN